MSCPWAFLRVALWGSALMGLARCLLLPTERTHDSGIDCSQVKSPASLPVLVSWSSGEVSLYGLAPHTVSEFPLSIAVLGSSRSSSGNGVSLGWEMDIVDDSWPAEFLPFCFLVFSYSSLFFPLLLVP